MTVVLLTSCESDIKEIQNLNYATSIGVDFKDGKYHLFIQLIDLSSVASTEGQDNPPQTFVSESTGTTFIDAFFEVYETGQEKFIWSHITSILLSEEVLTQGIENIFDGLTRYYEFRLTPWVFATKEPLKDVLTTIGFYDQSSLETILHNPERIHEQSSMIRPIKLHQFARETFEPGFTTYIPSITINNEHWKKGEKKEPKLALDGAFFLQNQHYKGFYTLEQLAGLRWVAPETIRASILVPGDDDAEFLVVVDHVSTDIILQEQQGNIGYQFIVNGEGNVANVIQGIDNLKKMEEKTNNSIATQIQELFELGVENDTDFLNLEHILYREKNKSWKQVTNGDFIQKDLLKDIKVDVKILHSGAFKNKQVQN